MPIKLIKIEGDTPDRQICILFADTKQEIPTTGTSTMSTPHLNMGSAVYTADGDVAFLKSDDTWNWVE